MARELARQTALPAAQNSGNQAQDPLALLRDIHLPETPGWWPPAPGWWLALLLLLLAMIACFWWLRARYQKQLPLKQFLGEIRLLKQKFEDRSESVVTTSESLGCMQALSKLVRQYAISAFGQSDVAGLSGDELLQFLDRTSRTTLFTDGPGRLLAAAPYQSKRSLEGAINTDVMCELLSATEQWARTVGKG